jgi:hypothetical protein
MSSLTKSPTQGHLSPVASVTLLIKSCTLGTVTNACLFQIVGAVGASRSSSTGDI